MIKNKGVTMAKCMYCGITIDCINENFCSEYHMKLMDEWCNNGK